MDFSVHCHEIAIIEREITSEKHEKNDSARPRVSLCAVVAFTRDDLRSRVRRRATSGVEQAVLELIRKRREAEVGDLEVAVLVQEKVLRLHVAVSHAVLVAEGERRNQLPEVTPRLRLRETAAAGDFGEEFSALGQFNDQVNLGLGGHDLVDFDDVGMLKAPHGRHLTNDPGLHAGLDALRLVNDLDGHGGAIGDGVGLVDLGEAAAAKKAAEFVLAKDHSGGSRFHEGKKEEVVAPPPVATTLTEAALCRLSSEWSGLVGFGFSYL